jgi:hypothetical protein
MKEFLNHTSGMMSIVIIKLEEIDPDLRASVGAAPSSQAVVLKAL